jgi:DNA-binding transcriptional ArsR family regulator
MNQDLAAKRFAELGHSTRLGIFRHLVKCGPNGCPVGEVQRILEIPGSTLSHHIARLVSAGLIEQQRDGRVLYCRPQFDAIDETLAYLMDACCTVGCPE